MYVIIRFGIGFKVKQMRNIIPPNNQYLINNNWDKN